MSDDKNSPDTYIFSASVFGLPFDSDDTQESSLEAEFDSHKPEVISLTLCDVDGECTTGTFKLQVIREMIDRFPAGW